METSEPRGSLPEDGGLWMKLDSSPVAAHARSLASDEQPQITRSNVAVEDEGAGDGFIPRPTEGSTEPSTGNSRVTLSKKAADATEAEANPSSLDWHHGEKQLMAAQVDEATVNTGHTSKESVDIECSPRSKTADQDTASVEDTAGQMETRRDQNRRDGDLNEEPEDAARQPDSRKCPQHTTTAEENQNEAPSESDRFTVNDEEVKSEQRDGTRKIATDIRRGEQLLQRLQLVQQRQDEKTRTVTQTAQKLGTEEETKEDPDEDAQADLMEQDNNQGARTSEAQGTEAERTDQGEAWVCALPALHRLSAVETSEEIREAAHRKQNLQRAGRVFNLSDDPDVLEIPFQTSIPLEPLPPTGGQSQRSPWQFSEQMHKEISVEVLRERVLVNQGTIPGQDSRGEVRDLKETELLFEAFQQVNTEGPTRIRKSPTSATKGHIYPSVLERTRSLEMFALKSCPIPRAHSLRLDKSGRCERERSPENIRSKSPTLGPRDKTRLCPYPIKDPHAYRSVDSLSPGASTPAGDARSKSTEDSARHRSPILKQNPFFKLRPALALQPEVEKDIREAREREEELRRQRSTLYGDDGQKGQEEERSQFTKTSEAGVGHQSAGRLERVWPPPSSSEQTSEQPQQQPRAQRAGGRKAPLWQRWESGLINGQQDDA